VTAPDRLISFVPQVSPPQQSATQRVGLVPIRQLDPGEVADAVKRGQELVATGKILPARLVLKKAAEMGNAPAALGGGEDPHRARR